MHILESKATASSHDSHWLGSQNHLYQCQVQGGLRYTANDLDRWPRTTHSNVRVLTHFTGWTTMCVAHQEDF
ncbi:hypothetical protein K443DRAFT_685494 [Laccaria amethystina LaAM-08-1]|uniref:Uncharacterized protein n=1 Tax=Laccaria amethystina LaAM-08-1 TaxID=1095629 RepID=A0A0C9WNM0_9AGAR|nr:hypothetical protein K443DRAFT_685494 [Laccaria amethystina LaAM-08-1]